MACILKKKKKNCPPDVSDKTQTKRVQRRTVSATLQEARPCKPRTLCLAIGGYMQSVTPPFIISLMFCVLYRKTTGRWLRNGFFFSISIYRKLSVKRLVYRIYKEFSQLNNKKTTQHTFEHKFEHTFHQVDI